jgi:hypothetical protein
MSVPLPVVFGRPLFFCRSKFVRSPGDLKERERLDQVSIGVSAIFPHSAHEP